MSMNRFAETSADNSETWRRSRRARCAWPLAVLALSVGCGDGTDGETQPDSATSSAAEEDGATPLPIDAGAAPALSTRFVLGSVTIDADGNRVSYAQIVEELDGHFTNRDGIEAAGNAVFLTRGSDFYYGLAESPEWVRYATDDGFKETGRLSFLNYGISNMDFANVIVDHDTAVSVLTEAYVAVVWNPTTMKIKGKIDLSHLQKDGYQLEAFTTLAYEGRVYVPGKWVNWDKPEVLQLISMTILDPAALEVVGVAEDDRCGAGGRVTFDARGYAYVMGDGRNQSMQVFAEANGKPSVPNCLLRIAPGETDFEQDFFFTIPELTGGLDSMTEMEAAVVDSGVAFSMMYYKDRLPEGLDLVNFEHWGEPAYKMWRISLGDEPKAEEVQGAHFSVVGFAGSAVNGKLYSSESADGSESTVYEIDPDENTAVEKFSMDGYFSALLPLDG
jgi:hypothetical protein